MPAAIVAVDRRLDGHDNPCRMDISTPTLPECGVDAEYQQSDLKRWIVECPKGVDGPGRPCDGSFETWDCVTWKNHPTIPSRTRSSPWRRQPRVLPRMPEEVVRGRAVECGVSG